VVLTLLAAAPLASDRSAALEEEDGLTAVSLNLAQRDDVDQIADELSAHGAGGADLFLLQEVVKRDGEADVAERLGQRLGLQSVFGQAFTNGRGQAVGLAILTRQPPIETRLLQLKRFDLGFRTRSRIALGVRVDTAAGPLHVFNVHLDTRINTRQRLDQLTAVTEELGALDGPAIVGGDFNTNDNRWVFHAIPLPFLGRQRGGVVRFMARSGFHSAFQRGEATHDFLGMQLDWLFLRGLRAGLTSIQPLQLSDHHALIASLSRPGLPQSTAAR